MGKHVSIGLESRIFRVLFPEKILPGSACAPNDMDFLSATLRFIESIFTQVIDLIFIYLKDGKVKNQILAASFWQF